VKFNDADRQNVASEEQCEKCREIAPLTNVLALVEMLIAK
jgi:hypothetical protein